ncbi:PD-(D/E)XK nuclease domain-containing protein [Paenibacillus terrae]
MGESMTTSNRTKSETIQAIQEQIDEVLLLTQSENNTERKLEEWRISTSRVLHRAFSNASIAREFLLKTDAETFQHVGVSYLKGLIIDINKGLFEKISHSSSSDPDIIDLQSFHVIIRRIMRNFYKHIEEMYQNPVHGRGTIRHENLAKISLGNEYDVQRMLFSLIRPIFPEARVEITDDGGYKSVRYDIYLREYETVIEVKCSRPKMSAREIY